MNVDEASSPPWVPVRRLAGRVVREAVLYPSLVMSRLREGSRVAFLPSSGRETGVEAEGLLRAYNIAEALTSSGWQSIVLAKHLELAQRNRMLHLFRPDLVVVQKTRHHLNRAEYLRDWPIVLDLDDADFLDPSAVHALEQLRDASVGAICGSRFIEDWACKGSPRTRVVWTGNRVRPGPWPDHGTRKPIVTWAQVDPVAYGKVLEFVLRVALAAAAKGAQFTLRLYNWRAGADDPRLEQLRGAGIEVELLPLLKYDDFMQSLRDVAIGLSPVVLDSDSSFDHGKSFGKILGYLDAKVPVICSDAVDHPLFFEPGSAIVSNDPEVWVDGIVDLLADPARRTQMSEAAHALYVKKLSVEAAARDVDVFLRSLISDPDRRAN